jgi:hypothetical protein
MDYHWLRKERFLKGTVSSMDSLIDILKERRKQMMRSQNRQMHAAFKKWCYQDGPKSEVDLMRQIAADEIRRLRR